MPAGRAPAATPPPAAADADRSWLATLTVLYVEDDAVTRDLLAQILRRRVGRVLEAADGQEGLARFRAERPALVVTDVLMPRLDGLAMVEQLRRIDPDVPVVVTTAFEQVDYLRRAIDAGVDKYVTKPVDVDKLEAALLSCAHRLRAEAQLALERHRELDQARLHEREALALLAGGMAHDFNNLLQAVLGNLGLAVAPRTSLGEQRELIEEAFDAARQAQELGEGLRTLAEGDLLTLRPAPLAPVLRAAVAGALAGSVTSLTLDLPDDLPPVRLQPDLLGRALGQLALNAREAMGGAGALSVTGRLRELAAGQEPSLPPGRYVELLFCDTGPGISPEIRPRIFQPYFTTKPRGTRRGLGLGLALCLAIVRRHGGLVDAPGSEAPGATLRALLPAAALDLA